MKNFTVELKPREEVLSIVHQSLIPNVGKFLVFGLWFLLPFFFLFPLFREGIWGIIVFFGLLFSGFFFLLRHYLRWSGTVLIVTDKRVIDIDRRGFFDRVVTEASFSQIDEVSYRVKGFWATVFRYGSLRLDLAGSAADIQFEQMIRPARVHDLLNDLREDHRHSLQ